MQNKILSTLGGLALLASTAFGANTNQVANVSTNDYQLMASVVTNVPVTIAHSFVNSTNYTGGITATITATNFPQVLPHYRLEKSTNLVDWVSATVNYVTPKSPTNVVSQSTDIKADSPYLGKSFFRFNCF